MIAQNINTIRDGQKLIDTLCDLFAPIANITQADQPVLAFIELRKLKALEQGFVRAMDIANNEGLHLAILGGISPDVKLFILDQDFRDLNGV